MSNIFETRRQVESFIYSSYLRAIKNIDIRLPDRETRTPKLTKQLLNMVQNPDSKQRNVLVTGSKGKGSVSRMISKLLEAHGYRVGLFTSPHLVNFNERIRINGIAISDENLIKYAEIVKPYVDEIEKKLPDNKYIGPVGLTSVMAMLYFYDNKTDFNIVECGKGARYDDVCMNESEISVINNVFLEHVPQLGNNLAEIAYNKAGIVKSSQKAVFSAEQPKEVSNIIEETAKNLKIELKIYGYNYISKNIKISSKGTTFDIITANKEYPNLQLTLLGRHQAKNAALAVGVAESLIGELDQIRVRESFRKLTWPGRLELVNLNPLTILDGCINRECASYVKEIIKEIGKEKMVFVIGIPDDKDFEGVLDEFSEDAYKIIMTTTKHQHHKFSSLQQVRALEMIKEKYLYKDIVDDAIREAYEILEGGGLLVILGTQSLIRETKEFFNQDTTNLD
uniref:bifunctional folylpolyglutamate synthase/dihydrofolate synthase n=1 Tax=Acetivibrio cellulolyticus TaxID=35830 RepID=UPI0002481CB7|nr:Mur ligase family protein [Acetivibrio cellulolyticus]